MTSSRQGDTEITDHRLFDYAKGSFKLSARVHLSHLVFETGFKRLMDQRRNIRRLERILRLQGCLRLMKENHVSVVVPQADWQHRVRPRAGNHIIPSLDVDLDYGLRALDHENLIAAARNTLAFNNQWWVVDVYVTEDESGDRSTTSQGLQGGFLQSLRERFSNEHRPSDGLIYERINYYEGHLDGPEDRQAADSWWAALEAVAGSKKGQYLRLFFRNTFLTRQLNALLAIPGLWDGMQIGNLHKVNAMHCDEAISCYWGHIWNTFLALVGDRRHLLQLIDGVTVALIESRVPKVSEKDKKFLGKKMDEGVLFPSFPENDRQEIWRRLKEIEYPIPSLRTFFRDRLYLEVPQSVMKQLFQQPSHVDDKVTIDDGVFRLWDMDSRLDTETRKSRFRMHMLELWRFSFQYGFEMTDWKRLKLPSGSASRSSSSQQHSVHLPSRIHIWGHFYRVMMARGFRIPTHVDLAVLPAAFPSEIPCEYPEDESEEVAVKKRSGKPSIDTVEADRYALSAASLQERRTPTRVTSGFLRQSVFKAFFSYLMDHDPDSGQRVWPEPSQDSIPRTVEYDPGLYTQSVQTSNISDVSPGSSFESAPFPTPTGIFPSQDTALLPHPCPFI
ncbi:uncharacterized protein N7469_001978 [Penicillium citrinum]|uniref:Uncharacterized protein n=1 Tax=Penicillium citrinum TaxID=5077 RepID=A0A9W9PCI0_PENCI|nr:uncharacterized protein N7469_001978 [Penicillium citrinum]KAJ5240387.1 hypothetical protein N7469_001978 [Penicillium citrinum]